MLFGLSVGFWFWRQATRPGIVHANQGAADAAAGNQIQAEQEWLAGVKEDPASPQCYTRLGDLYMQQKRIQEADAQYTAASKLTPNDGTLFFKLHFAALAVGDVPAARAAAKRAAELLPNDADAVGQYGLLESHSNNPAAALAALRRAHALRPDDPDFFHELVLREMTTGDFPAAEQLLTSWLPAHPQDAWACHLMAVVYEKKPPTPPTLQTALGYEKRAQAGLPDDLRIYITLGTLSLAANRPADALRAYQAGLRLEPTSGLMLHGLMTCYTRMGQPQQAAAAAARLQTTTMLINRIAHLQDTLRLNPSDVAAGLELAHLEDVDNNPSGAQNYYQQLMHTTPHDQRIRAALAAFYLRHGKPEMAKQAMRLDFVP